MAAAAGGNTTVTNHTTNHVTVNAKNADARAVAREVDKALIRNQQTGVKY